MGKPRDLGSLSTWTRLHLICAPIRNVSVSSDTPCWALRHAIMHSSMNLFISRQAGLHFDENSSDTGNLKFLKTFRLRLTLLPL